DLALSVDFMMIGSPPAKSWYVRYSSPLLPRVIHSRSVSGPWWLPLTGPHGVDPSRVGAVNDLPPSLDVHRSVVTASRSATYTVWSRPTSTSESPPPLVDAMLEL